MKHSKTPWTISYGMNTDKGNEQMECVFCRLPRINTKSKVDLHTQNINMTLNIWIVNEVCGWIYVTLQCWDVHCLTCSFSSHLIHIVVKMKWYIFSKNYLSVSGLYMFTYNTYILSSISSERTSLTSLEVYIWKLQTHNCS